MLLLVTAGAFSQTALQRVDRVLTDEFPPDKSGAVILISKGDSILYRKAFGLSDVEKKIPLREDMIFQIASMTKQFTGVAILQLLEQKKIAGTDAIQKYIEYFPDKGYVITIDHLLSQTSAIPEFFDLDESEYHLLAEEHTPKELIAYFKDKPLDSTPGTRFSYSNSNYVLLGAIIEKVSGLKYSEYMEQFVFQPNGMKNTSVWYKPVTPADKIAHGNPAVPMVGSVVYSSGGIVSNVDDLFLWTRSTVQKLDISKTPGYRYGFNIKELHGSTTIQHGGNLPGFTSSGIYLPEEEVFVCILSNAAFRGTEEIADYVASEIIGKPIEFTHRKVVHDLDAYTGVYRLKDNSTRTMKINRAANMLVLTFPDQPGNGVDIRPTGTDTFESKKVKAKLTFVRDSSGVVKQVDVQQGKVYTWLKE